MKSRPHSRVPTVRRLDWTTAADMPARDFLEDARRRGGFDEEAWARILWHGGLFVGRRRFAADTHTVVPGGSAVRVYVHVEEPRRVPLTRAHLCLQRGGVVAVDKPSGIAVQGTRASRRLSLEAELQELLGCEWLTPVHRLDAETSGVILFALDPGTCEALAAQFRGRSVRKSYLAWVTPQPAESRWRVTGHIVQVPHPGHACYALREEPCPGSRPSESRFEVVERRGDWALVRAVPVTGRTHQLRIHLAAGGTPIGGDRLYGSDAGAGAGRLLLHAESISLRLPGDAAPTTIRAPLPPELAPPGSRPPSRCERGAAGSGLLPR